jgi:hypothetical protein
MNLLRSAIGALIGGAIGAVIWGAVVWYTGYEIGWIAWGVGILAGVGAKLGTDEPEVATGILAAVLAVLSIGAAKYGVISIGVDGMLDDVDITHMTDELTLSYLADDVIAQWEAEGRAFEWPPEATGARESERDYPADAWALALERWNSLEAAEQQTYREELFADWRAQAEVSAAEFKTASFKESFAGMDLVFAVLAIITAFKIGAGTAAVAET